MLSKEEINNKYEYYFSKDKAIPFIPRKYRKTSKLTLNIKPITMNDYYEFVTFSRCLCYEKDIVNDVKILKMSYLEYLFYLMQQNAQGVPQKDESTENVFYKLLMILHLSLGYEIEQIKLFVNAKGKFCIGFGNRQKKYKKTNEININSKLVVPETIYNECIDKGEDVSNYIPFNSIVGFKEFDKVDVYEEFDIEINSKDFDEIRRIIMYQNVIDYDDTYIDPALKEDLRKEKEIRNNGNGDITIERCIVAIASHYKYDLSAIYNLTIRRFNLMLEFSETKSNCMMMKQASLSGMVSFKGDLPSYLSKPKEKEMQDLDTFRNKFKEK